MVDKGQVFGTCLMMVYQHCYFIQANGSDICEEYEGEDWGESMVDGYYGDGCSSSWSKAYLRMLDGGNEALVEEVGII